MDHLTQQRAVWDAKPALRQIYGDYYQRIASWLRPGATLEIGGGIGNFKSSYPDVISIDIQPSAGLDVVADAQSLPFRDGSFDNIVLVDVLHHVERPVRFLAEALRVLRPGGRVAMIEPGITPLSGVLLRLFHEEPVIMSVDPLADGPTRPGKDPYESNQAIPTLLAGRDRERMLQRFPIMSLARSGWLGLFAYPMSGGFQRWCLVPATLVRPLLRLEDFLMPVLGPLMATRMYAVLERSVGEPP